MKRIIVFGLLLTACADRRPAEQYGFVARLGRDTVSVESVTRRGNTLVSDEVDRFPILRRRHTEIKLGDNGEIQRLVMDIHTPSEPANERDRHVEATVGNDSVHITKRDGTGTKRMGFATAGGIAMAHLPQMYSLYELYFDAALRHAKATNVADGQVIQMRQFYIDREFDRFPLHKGYVRVVPGGKVEIRHDWLSGTGEATLDSASRLVSYSGARTTYKVDVERLAVPPDVEAIAAQFTAREPKDGGKQSLSPRDTVRTTIGNATFEVDYSRPTARGRVLVGGVIQYGEVWRTGANAATQFSTSAPITLAGLKLPAGMYTLWTIPRKDGVQVVVNRQTGQWGTSYNPAQDLGRAAMTIESTSAPVEKFTISIAGVDQRNGKLVMEWGPFRWTAPIAIQ